MIQESFLWITNCIHSSTNNFHIEGCAILVQLFVAKFLADPNCMLMAEDLRTKIRNKEIAISI